MEEASGNQISSNSPLKPRQFNLHRVLLVLFVALLSGLIFGTIGYSLGLISQSDQLLPANPNIIVTPTITQANDEDDLVTSAAREYCESQVSNLGQPLHFALGKLGPEGKSVKYSTNKLFAIVNSSCSVDKDQIGGSGAIYTLKKVDNHWQVLFASQQDDPEKNKLYGVPDEIFK